MDLSTLSNDQLMSLYNQQGQPQQTQQSPFAGMSDQQLIQMYNNPAPAKMGNALTDIPREIGSEFHSGVTNMREAFDPNSPTNRSQMNADLNAAPFDIGGQFMRNAQKMGTLVKGALGPLQALGAPITGAYNSIVGHSLAAATPQGYYGPDATPQDIYNKSKGEAGLALMAARPSAASPVGLNPVPTPLPTAADTRAAAESVYNDPSIQGRTVQPYQVQQAVDPVTSSMGFRKVNAAPQDYPTVANVSSQLNQMSGGRLPNGQIAPRPTVGDLDVITDRLGDAAGSTRLSQFTRLPEATPEAALATQLKQPVNDLIRQVAPEMQGADANYAAYKAASGFDRKANIAAIRADGGSGDYAARLRTVATQMLADPRATRGMAADDISRLQQIQHGTATQNALGWLGNQLGSKIAHGVGFLGGAALGYESGNPLLAIPGALAGGAADAAISKGVLGVRNALAQRQANALSNSLLAKSPLAKSLPPTFIPQSAEVAPQTMAAAIAAYRNGGSSGFGALPAYAGDKKPERRAH